MDYFAGACMALAVSLSATFVGFDRDRAFYPTMMIVIASYYGLFAVIGGSVHILVVESVVITAFLVVTVIGFKINLWFVVAALLAHSIFDLIHGHVVSNPSVPVWWPAFCSTYDAAAAGYLAWLLKRESALAA